jgi:hypothetical protein
MGILVAGNRAVCGEISMVPHGESMTERYLPVPVWDRATNSWEPLDGSLRATRRGLA